MSEKKAPFSPPGVFVDWKIRVEYPSSTCKSFRAYFSMTTIRPGAKRPAATKRTTGVEKGPFDLLPPGSLKAARTRAGISSLYQAEAK